jgi:DHA1 family bicyclomycin/chloramphenicol resistance-like MFS transporter
MSLLLACLGMLSSFAMDAYVPAFNSIKADFGAPQPLMQTTLTLYFAGFGAMNLLHGPLSDSFGRRNVMLWGMFAFSLASVGCALSGSVEQLCVFRAMQGMSAGAGTVVSRAVLRDRFSDAQAQKAMAGMMMFFAVGPAVAPIIGSAVLEAWGWRAVFWFLAGLGLTLFLVAFACLRESLPVDQRRKFLARPLLAGYRRILSNRRFLLLASASAISYNALFLYILASPTFLGRFLALSPAQYFWLFAISIAGLSLGAGYSAYLSTRLEQRAQLVRGFAIMMGAGAANVAASVWLPANVYWTLPLVGSLAFGWALLVPVVSVQLLDMVPEARGMAASVQLFLNSVASLVVSAGVVPLAIRSIAAMALASLVLLIVGLVAWRIADRSPIPRPAATG